MKVRLISRTEFLAPEDVPWTPDLTDADGPALCEFAGRACYQSWSKPNPATATNEGYIKHILEIGHLSVFEHASASFYITGVSRSLTHELVRHRHLSFSQLSQRYVPEGRGQDVPPPLIQGDTELENLFVSASHESRVAYNEMLAALERKFAGLTSDTKLKKLKRQTARAVLMNAAETRITVTGNYRAWRHFINLRATEHADVEIRALAVGILRLLQQDDVARAVFQDYTIKEHNDISDWTDPHEVKEGRSEIAVSPFQFDDMS